MAEVKDEVVEYESDPEEAKQSLKMRRREASDDEEVGEDEGKDQERIEKPLRRIDSDDEEGQGGADDYEDDEDGLEEEVEEDYVEDEEYEEEGEEEGGDGQEAVGEVQDSTAVVGEGTERMGSEAIEVPRGVDNDGAVGDEHVEVEKKENEPFAVPTAGAFYMHDDRFRDNSGGRNRRTFGGRKLWESKDERKWGHDKFEEVNTEDSHYRERGKISRGRYRGRGRNRGPDHGYQQGRRSKSYNDTNYQIANNQNQNNAPRGVRGRGPRRYRASYKYNNEAPIAHYKQSGNSLETPSRGGSGKSVAPTLKVGSDVAPAGKQIFMSSLNSASPPFYPSSSTTKEISLPQKRDVLQAGTVVQSVQSSAVGSSSSAAQSNTIFRGKNVTGSIGMDKLTITDSFSASTGKPSNNLRSPLPNSLNNTAHYQELRVQGRGMSTSTHLKYQTSSPDNQVNRISTVAPQQNMSRNTFQSRGQPPLQTSGKQLPQRLGLVSRTSPPKKSLPLNKFEPEELESSSEASKLKMGLVGKGKGKGSVSGSGKGSVSNSGTQVIGGPGSMNSGQADHNFPSTPAFLPVMQFSGQHPGGIGVPAVGMAFPGYVGQPQLGLGNSEMTCDFFRLPVLAGAAGALGAAYCPPYISVDGAYHTRPSGQMSSPAISNKDTNSNKPNNEAISAQNPVEVANDDFGQRQKNPRRYTEMKFDQ